MRICMIPAFLVLLVLPASPQHANPAGRANQNLWASKDVRPEPLRASDIRAAQLESIHHDAEELSLLNASLQTQLQQLQKGILHKDLAQNLKRIEKLSKKLRQEVAQ
jgi:hypothetical protein